MLPIEHFDLRKFILVCVSTGTDICIEVFNTLTKIPLKINDKLGTNAQPTYIYFIPLVLIFEYFYIIHVFFNRLRYPPSHFKRIFFLCF